MKTENKKETGLTWVAAILMAGVSGMSAADPKVDPDRDCFFGDTHAHTMLSGDAFGFGNRLSPDNAYLLDAVELGLPPSDMVAATIQERAWTSPIWYTPAKPMAKK